jgi:Toluene-4-monooxygenase system protein B (TmoB)
VTLALLSRLQNDAHVRVIDVQPEQTMDEVAAACAAPAVDRQVRHPNASKPLRVRMTTPDDSAPPIPRDTTVSEAGFRHFDCVDVFVE